MTLEDEDNTWLLALEAAVHDGSDVETLLSVTRGRTLPDEHRAQVWYQCLGGGVKISNFSQFDEVFDLPEQSIIRADCQAIVATLGNSAEEQVSVVCDLECVLSHYCKSRHLQYTSSRGWTDLVSPMLAARLTRHQLYGCFEELLEKYIPREVGSGAPVYHLLRLLLLYHDPELSNYLDSLKISPHHYAAPWVRSLFAVVCGLEAVLALWDAYLQERDPFFMLFLSLVILINARDQILGETDSASVVANISSLPAALTPTDAPDFCSLARYYAIRTPNTFRKEFQGDIFGSVYLSGGSADANNFCTPVAGALPLQQSLCLSVTAEELLQTSSQPLESALDHQGQVAFFLVDCRPAEQYNSGHHPNAFHLDSSLMLEARSSFQTALQALFIVQRQAVEANTPGCGLHLCLLGAGHDQSHDQLLHMVAATMLQQHTAYVSLAKGGYYALHSLLAPDFTTELTDHNPATCLVCSPTSSSAPTSNGLAPEHPPLMGAASHKQGVGSADQHDSILDKFSSISSVFKTKSAEMKGKLVEYITNPLGDDSGAASGTVRHASPDDTGELYRQQEDIFTINDDDTAGNRRAGGGRLRRVMVAELLRSPDTVASFACDHVRETGLMTPSYLVLSERGVVGVRVVEGGRGDKEEGEVVATRSLASIMKITSKKAHPDLITFKYGVTRSDGETVITDMDRFLIPNASRATQAVKELILRLPDQSNPPEPH